MRRAVLPVVLLLASVLTPWIRGWGEEDGRPWQNRRPDLSLLFVGGVEGEFRPCGCRDPRAGGLERLGALSELHRRRGGDGAGALALGWTLSGSGEPQAESKATWWRAALETMAFDAQLLGTSDLRVAAMIRPFEGGRADAPHPPVNVPLAPSGPGGLAAATDPIATFERGGWTIRAFSVLDPDDATSIADLAPVVLPPAGALQALSPREDALWIAATDAGDHIVSAVAAAMERLGPGVVVDLGGGGGQRVIERAPLAEGPHVVALGAYGVEAGVLDLERDGDGWRLSWHVVPLDQSFDEVGGAGRARLELLEDAYRREVRERGYLASFTYLPDIQDVRYVGSNACARCHAGIYADWLATPHASSFDRIEAAGDHWDPECVRCHVVGFERFGDRKWARARSGFRDPERTPHLMGVGCESCHGPGGRHVESPEDASVWGAGGPNVAEPGIRTCRACHDERNDVAFDRRFPDLLPAVDHRRVPEDRRTHPPLR